MGDDWKILLFLLALGFALRVFLVIYLETIYYDGTEYVRHAKEFLAGNWTAGKPTPAFPAFIVFIGTG
jgi:hypothetical protein